MYLPPRCARSLAQLVPPRSPARCLAPEDTKQMPAALVTLQTAGPATPPLHGADEETEAQGPGASKRSGHLSGSQTFAFSTECHTTCDPVPGDEFQSGDCAPNHIQWSRFLNRDAHTPLRATDPKLTSSGPGERAREEKPAAGADPPLAAAPSPLSSQAVVSEECIPVDQFVEHLLPSLVSLASDPVPNVRVLLAKALRQTLLEKGTWATFPTSRIFVFIGRQLHPFSRELEQMM